MSSPLVRLLSVGALILILTLAGCQSRTFHEDDYDSEVFVDGKWSVKFDGNVVIQMEENGSVSVYGSKGYADGAQNSLPNVKVSGKVPFHVHSCKRLTVDEGVTVSAYGCELVRARKNASVTAFNCDLVEAHGTVEVLNPRGTTKIKYLPEPDATSPGQEPVKP